MGYFNCRTFKPDKLSKGFGKSHIRCRDASSEGFCGNLFQAKKASG
jgi:hypothetical protein